MALTYPELEQRRSKTFDLRYSQQLAVLAQPTKPISSIHGLLLLLGAEATFPSSTHKEVVMCLDLPTRPLMAGFTPNPALQ